MMSGGEVGMMASEEGGESRKGDTDHEVVGDTRSCSCRRLKAVSSQVFSRHTCQGSCRGCALALLVWKYRDGKIEYRLGDIRSAAEVQLVSKYCNPLDLTS